MSIKWYPIIHYDVCVECGVCTDKCKHGVYDIGKAPTPIVVNGNNCIEGCHGCGNLCPTGTITYAGDVNGNSSTCECGGNC